MKKLITNLKMLKLMLVALLLSAVGLDANAQAAPWCDGYHMYNNTTNYTSSNYIFALEQVRISVGTQVIYNHAADGYSGGSSCGLEWRLSNSPSRALDFTAGNTYTVEASGSSGSYAYGGSIGVFIDFNNDKDFLDAGEYLGGFTVPGTVQVPSTLGSKTFTIPCNVTPSATRMRVVGNYSGYPMSATYGCSTCSGAPYYGETVDFSINLVLPTSVSANFVAPTSVWVKTVNKFINSNQSGYTEHAWDANNDGTWEQRGVTPNYSNSQFLWSTPGNKCVKLRSTNCLGKDSIVKCFSVVAPTAIPVVDFVADRVLIEQYESMQLFDLSSNGPYDWAWDVYDSTTYASSGYYPNLTDGDLYSDPWGNGNNEFTRNPEFAFDVPGCYTVVLTARNDVGPSAPKRKVCYITVTLPTQYNLGYGTYGPNNDNIVGSPSGTIFDDGGPNLSYGGGQGLGTRSYLQITPCNASKIVLKMTQLKFKDAADKLSVWDGKSPGGPGTTLLASWGMNSRAPQSVTATSGSMYLLFESDAAGTDSGYAGSYTSELGPASLPVPHFSTNTVPSYNATPVLFTNTTTNIVGVPTWEWTIDDNQVARNANKDFRYTFYTDGQYKVCLEIKSCVGNNKSCTTIDVVTPSTQTTLDFIASNRRPNINVDITTLKPISDKANRFEWTIFPATYTLMNPPAGPSTYGTGFIKYNATPGDSIPTPRLKFTSPGCYTITLKAYNSLDPTNTTKTVVKNKFICALDYCSPSAYILSSDVGINRVKVLDGSTELINNYSTSGVASYTNYSNTIQANLTFGKSYNLEVSRTGTVDPANRKAWIDWNIDGDFDDAGEQILAEGSTYNSTINVSFTVPALSQSFEGLTKLRIAANYNNESTTNCGPITAGEFEDYGIVLYNDNNPPVITLIGSDTVRIEVGTTYTDAGATAYDASEGPLTPIGTTDLDATVTGLYTYEYNVTDKSGNKAAPAIRTIIVVNDLTKPVLTLNPGNAGCIEARRDNAPYVDPGATATDNKAPFNLTSSILTTGSVDSRTIGNYVITYSVKDVAGNMVSKTRTVCVEDTKAPLIDTLGDNRIQIGSVWFDQTTATDAYDNSPVLVKNWGFNGPVNTLLRRTYPVVYTAYDQSSNQATATSRNYRVDDFIAPIISLNTFDVVYHEVRTAYNSVSASVTDNYYGPGQVSLVKIFTDVDATKLGTYTEVFEAVDGSGNKTQKTRTVKVVDTEAPRIWGDIIHGCVGENIWPMYGISTTDNYYSPADLKPLVEIVNQNVNIWEEGIYSITYRVTDPSNNTSNEFTRLVYFTYWPKCFNSTVSVNDVKSIEETVSVYPNPSNGIVNIDLQGLVAKNASIEVYNAMGQLILVNNYTESNSKFEINLNGNASGVYTIKLIADGQVITKRVVLQ